MTVTTEDGGRQNLFAKEPQVKVMEVTVTHNEKAEMLNGRFAMLGIIAALGAYASQAKSFLELVDGELIGITGSIADRYPISHLCLVMSEDIKLLPVTEELVFGSYIRPWDVMAQTHFMMTNGTQSSKRCFA